MRHTPEHDVWAPDGRCDVIVAEPDGTFTRCGFVPGRPSFDTSQATLESMRPVEDHSARDVIVAVVMGVLGIAIALDWVAFVLYVSREELDPQMALAFIVRVAVTAGFAAAAVWLWRRRGGV